MVLLLLLYDERGGGGRGDTGAVFPPPVEAAVAPWAGMPLGEESAAGATAEEEDTSVGFG